MKNKRANKAGWCTAPLVPCPVYYGLFASEELFKKKMKELKVSPHSEWLGAGDAGCVHPLKNPDNDMVLMVAIRPTETREKAFEVIAHEAVHVWQFIKEYLGEDEPSREFEAYSIESIYTALTAEYDQQLGYKRK